MVLITKASKLTSKLEINNINVILYHLPVSYILLKTGSLHNAIQELA